jgi:hypothetical protein
MTRRVGVIAGAFALIAVAAGAMIADRGWSLATTLLVGLGAIAVLTAAALAVALFFDAAPPRTGGSLANRRSP